MGGLKTTRPVADVRSLADIIAIESQPYDALVPAHNIYDLFKATAATVGDGKALTVLRSEDPADIGAAFTHGEFLLEINQAANMFRRLGLEPEHGVAAFLAPTLPELPALLFGAEVAGIASSLNYLLSQNAIFDLLNAEQATLLVIPSRQVDEMCWSKAEGVFAAVPSLERVIVIGGDTGGQAGYVALQEAMDGVRSDALDFEPVADRDAVCALFHTGGTTGRPKLVRLTHGNHIHAAFGFAQVCGYNESDTVINGFPFFHVGGTMTVGLSVLAAGGHIVVPSPYGLRLPRVVARYWDLIEHFKATVVSGVPTSIAALTNAWKPGTDISGVRMALTGGAVLPKAVCNRFMATTGIALYETYGMTETAAAIAFNPGHGAPLIGSVGFRAPYSETRILRLDPANPGVCGPNESGLVQVRGPQVFPGYIEPAHNEGVLDEDGWLTTGDIGYLSGEGRLFLTGREKDLIVRSGHNIDPAAIEDVANQFEGVQISAAVGMPDQYAGEVPALFVVAAENAVIDMDGLKQHLETHMHEPPARPKSVLQIEALPVTAVGKLFKPALRDLAIKEKVRLETARICGADALAEVDVRLDDQKNTLVDVVISGANAEQLAELDAALKPLPQTYALSRAGDADKAESVTLTYDKGIAVLTLDRPDSLNAMSQVMIKALERQIEALKTLPDLRVVVVTGTGRAFSAGGDLIEFEQAYNSGKTKLLEVLRYNMGVLQMVEDIPVPVIAAANGTAVAGGLELLLCCDIIIAAEGAKMGDGHTRYGIVPAGGATVRLGERISPSRAAQLFYTAGLVEAETLRDWGLVNETVPLAELMDRAMAIADEISQRSPEAIRHVKLLTGKRARTPDRAARLEAELEQFALHLDGADLAKGLLAFSTKQKVKY